MATVYKYRVLLVDNDIQANVSKFFGVHSYDYKSMENVLRDTDTMAEDVIRSSGRVGLDIIPANMNMDAAAVDLMLDQEANQIVRLKGVLDQVEEQYDYKERGSNDRSTERMEWNAGRMERSSRSVRTHSESNTGSGKTDCKQLFRVL